ncbi:calcyclin binding protein, putative [Plasmodium malariae]|uniref:Calcyclin binding protein, putative n=1 Tax=Plasmodium malariae TaxID=5858 RepID=A0A1C3KC06_PLAMA|nr:calcyclin binding protein, putative [Plasmodium malariae]
MDNATPTSDNVFTNTELDKLNKLKHSKLAVNESIIRSDFSQTDSSVFFTIYKKNVEKDNFLYYIRDDYLFLTILINEDEIYSLKKNLFSKILPLQTRINVTPMKVEVILEKEVKDLEWSQLEKKEKSIPLQKKENILNPFSGKSTQEWDKLTQSIKEEDDEGGIDNFFKKIYEQGDDDTKRAMIKSFQTSCGTVLSTNWKDVQNKNYEKEI